MVQATYSAERVEISGTNFWGFDQLHVFVSEYLLIAGFEPGDIEPILWEEFPGPVKGINAIELEGAGLNLEYTETEGLEYLRSTEQDDTLVSDSATFLTAILGAGNDRLETAAVDGDYDLGEGSDALFLSGGGDVDGGEGHDVVYLDGVAADYMIDDLGNGEWRLTPVGDDPYGSSAVDLKNVEVVTFGGGGQIRLSEFESDFDDLMEDQPDIEEDLDDLTEDIDADFTGGPVGGNFAPDDLGWIGGDTHDGDDWSVPAHRGAGSETSGDLILLDVGPLSAVDFPVDELIF